MDNASGRPAKVRQPRGDAGDSPNKKLLAKPAWFRRWHLWPRDWPKNRRMIANAILFVVLILLIGGGVVWYQQSHHKPAPKKVVTATKTATPAAPTTVASRLSGVQIEPKLNSRPVTGIMIENSPDARPQSGLPQAGVVYEAVAEGGITRFLALYMEGTPDYIGPVRSSRPYYLDWLLPFDASYAHAGGSPEALAQIGQLGVKNLDEFANPAAYMRVSSRYAPHNLYTSFTQLDALEASKGFTSSTFTSFPRKDPLVPKAGAVNSIDLAMSSYLYNPHYDYDVATNTYKRSEGGKPHIDEKSGQQLAPTVVVALVMPSGIEPDGTHSSYSTVGANTMYVFQDGGLQKGTWSKASRTAQFTFTDDKGQPMKLDPGQTWITMVNSDSSVSYK